MTETLTGYIVETEAIALELTELEQLNLEVAAIAGWTDIKPFDNSRSQERKPKKRLFIGNHDRKELGIFIPDYANDLNAIVTVFYAFEIPFDFTYSPACESYDDQFIACSQLRYRQESRSSAIALCKLLLELNPIPKPKPSIQVIDDDGEIEPMIIEATFG